MTTDAREGPESQIIHMRVDQGLLKRLDDFRFDHRFESRSDAFRWLARAALDRKLIPSQKKGKA